LVQELEASQPTISKHLKVLREADLVSMRAQGQKRYYTLNPKPLAGIASWLETFDVGPATVVDPAPAQMRDAGVPAVTGSLGEAATAAGPARPPMPAAVIAGRPAGGALSPAVVIPVGTAGGDKMPQQIGRTVGRAATKAADLLANLPKFGRRK
jgi:hypothetical protein